MFVRSVAVLVTNLERDILEILGSRPMTFTALRRRLVVCGAEDLRPSTVSGLLLGLLNCGLVAEGEDGRLAITRTGHIALDHAGTPSAGR